MTTTQTYLASSLDAIGPRLGRWLRWLALAELGLTLSVFIAVSYALDRLVELPLAARLTLLLGTAALLVIVGRRAWHRLRQRLERQDLIAAVEARDPELDGQLAAALELPGELAKLEAASARGLEGILLEKALEESTRRAGAAPVTGALSVTPVLRRLAAAMALAVLVLAIWSSEPAAFGLWFRRNVCLSSELWPRRTHFVLEREGTEWHHPRKDPLPVLGWVHGEVPAEIRLDLEGEGGGRAILLAPGAPSQVTVPLPGDTDETTIVEGHRLEHVIPAVLEPLALRLRGGDNESRLVRVEVHDRPRLLATRFQLDLPAYLGQPARSLDNPAGDIRVPRGTQITVSAESDQELESGWWRLGQEARQASEVDGKTVRFGFTPTESGFLDLGVVASPWSFESDPPLRFSVIVVPDRDPTVTLQIDGEQRIVTPQGKVAYSVRAEDDHGFSALALETRVLPGGATREEGLPVTQWPLDGEVRQEGERLKVALDRELDIGPLGLAPGSTLLVQAVVRDNDTVTGPKGAASQVERIAIVSPEELRAAMERLRIEAQEKIQSIARREDEIALALQELALNPEELEAAAASPSAAESANSAESTATQRASRAPAAGRPPGQRRPGTTAPSSPSDPKEKASPEEGTAQAEPEDRAVEEQAAQANDAQRPAGPRRSAERGARPDARSASTPRDSGNEPPGAEPPPADEGAEAETSAEPSEPQASDRPAGQATPRRPAGGKSASPRSSPARPQGQEPGGEQPSAESGEEPNAGPESPPSGSEQPGSEPQPSGESAPRPPQPAGESRSRQLAAEQRRLGDEARDAARRLREMATTLRDNNLLDPAEERRLEDEIARPLDEAAEERLPGSSEQIRRLEETERPAEAAQEAQRTAERIARDMERVAERLAGSGDFREILQRLEIILELQRRAIGETEKRVPEKEASP